MPAPKPRLLGGEILRASVVSRLLPQLWMTHRAQPPIPIRRWARNNVPPNAWLPSALGEALNQTAMQRTKQVFHSPADPNAFGVARSGVARDRWRWAFHTGPLTNYLEIKAVMHPTAGTFGDTYSTVEVKTMAGANVQTDNFHSGANPGGSSGYQIGWQYLKEFTTWLPVTPDTDYQGLFTDGPNALLHSACVSECTSMTDNLDGYMPQNFVERSPILGTDRQRLLELARMLWRKNGAHIHNWFVDISGTAPLITTATTVKNVVDPTVTTFTATTPGVYHNQVLRDRDSQTTGVPCRMYAYGRKSSSTPDGNVLLKNSAGTVAQIAAAFTSTASWQSVDFNMPAVLDKYDLQFSQNASGGGAGQFELHAVSIFPIE